MDIVDIDVTELVDGTLVHKGQQPQTPEDGDQEPIYGDSFETLGLWACAAPQNDDGKCEGLKIPHVGGLNEVIVGRRDTRIGKKMGKALPGDTGILSTDPNSDVQVRCHGSRRQLVMWARKDSATGEQGMLVIDAKNEKFQLVMFGGILEYSKKNGWIMRDDTSQGFQLKGGNIQFSCTGKLTQSPAGLPLRQGQAPIGGTAVPGWFAMVGYLFAWLKWWVWSKLPKMPEAERLEA